MGRFGPGFHEIHHRSLQVFGGGFYSDNEGFQYGAIGILITKVRQMRHKICNVFSALLPQLAAD